MIKKTFISALCALVFCPAWAQTSTIEEKVEYSTEKHKVETNNFFHNWFVSAGAGVQFYMGDHDGQCKFGDRLAPALDVAIGKWFTPGIGVRFTYSGLQIYGATQTWNPYEHIGGAYNAGKPVPGKHTNPYGYLDVQKFNMLNLHADVMFNLNNLFAGYNPKRVWNISPYLGVGWGHVYDSPTKNEITANLGLINSFRLCDALALNVDVHGMFVGDGFDGEGGGTFGECLMSASVGLTYNFKNRGWNRSKTVYRYDYGDLESMREKLNQIAAENERLKKTLADKDLEEARTIIKNIASSNLIIFPIGKSTLSNEARVNLSILADIIKNGDADLVYTITGYADAATGNERINKKLSKDRANAVYKCLVEEFGVNKAQLQVDYKGGVENMFYNDPRLSRAVITKCTVK